MYFQHYMSRQVLLSHGGEICHWVMSPSPLLIPSPLSLVCRRLSEIVHPNYLAMSSCLFTVCGFADTDVS